MDQSPPPPPGEHPPFEALHPELTPQRVLRVGRAIRRFWNLKTSQRRRYDCNWNIGCDCYQWVRAGIRRLADRHPDWLRIVNDESDLAFLFLIGRAGLEVPAEFYRPDAHNQPAQTLQVTDEELVHRQLAFSVCELPPEDAIRFAIARGMNGRVERVTLVQLDTVGDPVYTWPIPLSPVPIVNLSVPREEAVQLPEPEVGLSENEDDEDEDQQNTQGRQKA